jgi:hypothetical protein
MLRVSQLPALPEDLLHLLCESAQPKHSINRTPGKRRFACLPVSFGLRPPPAGYLERWTSSFSFSGLGCAPSVAVRFLSAAFGHSWHRAAGLLTPSVFPRDAPHLLRRRCRRQSAFVPGASFRGRVVAMHARFVFIAFFATPKKQRKSRRIFLGSAEEPEGGGVPLTLNVRSSGYRSPTPRRPTYSGERQP